MIALDSAETLRGIPSRFNCFKTVLTRKHMPDLPPIQFIISIGSNVNRIFIFFFTSIGTDVWNRAFS